MRLLAIGNSLFFWFAIGSLIMGERATSKQTAYAIRILGRLPVDLVDKISRLHASSLLDGRHPASPQTLGGDRESQRDSKVELLTPDSPRQDPTASTR